MSPKKKLIGLTIAATAAVAFASAPLSSALADAKMDYKCVGGNSCKGQSTCKGTSNACKGQNTCKGKGMVMSKSQADCEKLQKENKSDDM